MCKNNNKKQQHNIRNSSVLCRFLSKQFYFRRFTNSLSVLQNTFLTVLRLYLVKNFWTCQNFRCHINRLQRTVQNWRNWVLPLVHVHPKFPLQWGFHRWGDDDAFTAEWTTKDVYSSFVMFDEGKIAMFEPLQTFLYWDVVHVIMIEQSVQIKTDVLIKEGRRPLCSSPSHGGVDWFPRSCCTLLLHSWERIHCKCDFT